MKLPLYLIFVASLSCSCQTKKVDTYTVDDNLFISYEVDPKKQDLAFYLKHNGSKNFSNFKTLK